MRFVSTRAVEGFTSRRRSGTRICGWGRWGRGVRRGMPRCGADTVSCSVETRLDAVAGRNVPLFLIFGSISSLAGDCMADLLPVLQTAELSAPGPRSMRLKVVLVNIQARNSRIQCLSWHPQLDRCATRA